jgi:hypothetical protein
MKFTIKNELLLEILLFWSGILTIGMLYNSNLILTLFLIVYWMIGIKFWHKTQDLYFFITGAVVGPIGEIICIHFGVWHYANPTLFGIPIWLPFVWGLATILIKRIVETFVRIEMK